MQAFPSHMHDCMLIGHGLNFARYSLRLQKIVLPLLGPSCEEMRRLFTGMVVSPAGFGTNNTYSSHN